MSKKIGCVIMAAGSSVRFGKNNKLLETFDDTTVIERVLDAVPYSLIERCLLVAGSEEILNIATRYNIQVLINTKPELGIGRTIKLGTTALGPSFDGYMYIVGDQPLLSTASLTKLISFWRDNPTSIVSLGYENRIGNPMVFPKLYYPEMMALKDNEYGRVVYRRHIDQLKSVQVSDEYELMDIDTIEDLKVLKEHLKK
ncbi:MAG: nucleotidyltransferase family protein [Eubacteriales bacterium]